MSTTQPNQDLFEESRMSFGQHLEELRKVLIRALIGIAAGCVIGFFFANDVVHFLETPLLNATKNFRVGEARQRLLDENGFVAPNLQKNGIFSAGVAKFPGDVSSSIQDSTGAALKAIQTVVGN